MTATRIEIACLCAAWCRLCDDYRAVLGQVQAECAEGARDRAFDGVALRWHWIDIEDEADLLDDFEVETFPTILIVDPLQVRFAGPLTPQLDTLRRLLRATVLQARPDANWPAAPAPLQALAARLRGRATPP